MFIRPEPTQWTDWRWQLRNVFRTKAAFESRFVLSDSERVGLEELGSQGGLPLGITPHYYSLIDQSDPADPLRLQVVPNANEFALDASMRRDPLGEEDHEVVPHLVHRYPDRVLLLITDRCAAYCRFCTRKRWVGQGPTPKPEAFDQALAYIRQHPEVKEVIVSGGDALMLDNPRIEAMLVRLRSIGSLDIIRIASRMLTFAPMRVDEELVRIMSQHHPVYLMVHFNHPRELSQETRTAILKLVDAGIPVLNQTVLLKGVNDSVETLSHLFRELTSLRVRPYYLHQCDLAPGTAQFRVPIDEALAIVKSMRGNVSGLSLPQFILDIPGGYGKVPLAPNPVVARDEAFLSLQGFDGEIAQYPLN